MRPDQGLSALLAGTGHSVERFPAVVVLHGCSGLSSHSAGIADRLGSWDYVGLAVDSLGLRDVATRCNGTGSPEQAFELSAALPRSAASVDAARIAVLSQSMDGNAVLYAVDRDMAAQYFTERFQAAIAYFSACLLPLVTLTVPTLILANRTTGPHRNAVARWLPMRGPTARRLLCTSARTPSMPSMLPSCSLAASLLATWSNTTSRPPRTRKNGHEYSSPHISPRHLPPQETGVRVDPLSRRRSPKDVCKSDDIVGSVRHIIRHLRIAIASEIG